MNIYFDNALIQKITKSPHALTGLMDDIVSKIGDGNQKIQLFLNWPTLLEYLELGDLFETFPKFGEHDRFFELAISTLNSNADQELLFHLFDQIFVDCLTQVKELAQIQQPFLLNRVRTKRESSGNLGKELFGPALKHYEDALINEPYKTMHDLTLYLAWDRMCINLAIIFEHLDESLNFVHGVKVLKDCLIESFQHILTQGKTLPGFFRLMEALYAYQMREEHLQNYNEVDWQILCRSSQVLRPSERLVGAPYIDEAINENLVLSDSNSITYSVFTMDSLDKIQTELGLACYMIRMIEMETGRRIFWKPLEIFRCMEMGSEFHLEKMILNRL
jgi:hypothetical protein